MRPELEIELCGEQLLLSPEKAVIWPARRTVLIADAHFGKDDVFRRAGIAVPRGPALEDLQRLSRLVGTGTERLIVLGDFLHGVTHEGDGFLQAFDVWRRTHAQLEIEVVAGNHDRRERRDKWSQQVNWRTGPQAEPPFVWSHEPRSHGDGYVFAGHIHPVVALPHAGSRHGVQVPVFWRRPDYLVLPSFGNMTRGARIVPEGEDIIYLAAPERVVRA